MKILHTVEFYHPSVGGAQEVVRQLSEHMVRLGHNVTVATSYLPGRKDNNHNGVKIVDFRITGNKVRGYQGDIEVYKDYLRNNKFDVIMNYAAQQWATDLYFEVMHEIKARKVFVPCGFSGLYDPAYKEYFKRMPEILKKYDATIYLSPTYRDIVFAKKHGVQNMHVIPNGADEREFHGRILKVKQKLNIADASMLIVHLGSFTGQKGQPEAMKIYKQAKIGDSTLVLIGNVFDKKVYRHCCLKSLAYNSNPKNIISNRKIIIKNLNRHETVSLLREADLFLFPSNIEASPLVLFEACAAKTPFMSTDVGNASEIVEWTKGGVIMPTTTDAVGNSHPIVAESAQMLRNLCHNRALRKKLARDGFKSWQTAHSWEKIVTRYLALYR